jgi:hypothetical protein
LRLEVADLAEMAFDLSLIGFGESEQAALLNTTEGLTDPDDAPEPGDRITPHQYRECETGGTAGLPLADPITLAATYNLHRRHLSTEERKDAAAALLKLHPERSNRSVAAEVTLAHKTVAQVRKNVEATGEIPQLVKRVGRDGKARVQPAAKKQNHADTEADRAATPGGRRGTQGSGGRSHHRPCQGAAEGGDR